MTRIYQNSPLSLDTPLVLDEAATHHIARVLRAAVGDVLTVFNGQGGQYQGKIIAISKKAVTVQLEHFAPVECESPVEIVLAQGIARGEKMDLIIQKAVELGVSKIIPLQTELSEWKNVISIGNRSLLVLVSNRAVTVCHN